MLTASLLGSAAPSVDLPRQGARRIAAVEAASRAAAVHEKVHGHAVRSITR